MAGKVTAAENSAWRILLEMNDLVTKSEESVFAKAGITNQQFHVLLLMVYFSEANNGPVIITDLAPPLNRSLNSISSIIDRMEQSGVVERVWDLPDRRSARLLITSKGEAVLKKAVKPHARLIKRLLANFTDEELQTFISLMKKFRSGIKKELHQEEVREDKERAHSRNLTRFLNRLNGYT